MLFFENIIIIISERFVSFSLDVFEIALRKIASSPLVTEKYSFAQLCRRSLFENFLPGIAISCFAASFLTPSIVSDLFPLNNDFQLWGKNLGERKIWIAGGCNAMSERTC